MTESLQIVELSPELAEDYFRLFDTAFTDNPAWAGCYCAYHDDTSGASFDDADGTRNRPLRAERLLSGEARGLLAYEGDRPVGWCNVGPRSAIPNLRGFRQAIDDPDDDPAVILCFVIPPPERRKGIATALVEAAIESSRRWGAPWLEAYPDKAAPTGESARWTVEAHRGTLPMFEQAGFTSIREVDDWLVVRHDLRLD